MTSISIDNRMKRYEHVSRYYLTRRMPVIIRIDGKAFHSFTRGFNRPYDELLISAMQLTMLSLCEEIQNCKIGYTQSDEINLLLIDYETHTTESWFNNNIQKMASIAASIATRAFNMHFSELVQNMRVLMDDMKLDSRQLELLGKYRLRENRAMFDARVFSIPREEACNCFIWRQQDATRNSIQMLGQSYFSQSQLQNKSTKEIQEMLFQQHKINFNDLDTHLKRGSCAIRETYEIPNGKSETGLSQRSQWVVDLNIPIFTADRNYIEKFVYPQDTISGGSS